MAQNETAPHAAISQLLDGQRKFHEAKEAAIAQERKHWQSERESYFKRIKELEDIIVALTASTHNSTTAATISPLTNPADALSQSNQAFSSLESKEKGRAIWNPESTSTRTFSEIVIPQSTSTDSHIGDIERKKSVGFDFFSKPSSTRHTSLAGVDGELVHPDYAGITVRPSALPPHLRQKVTELSRRSGNMGNEVPQANPRPKLVDIPTANLRSEEFYSADVGHTPLARVIGSEGTTGTLTPVPQPPRVPDKEDTEPVVRLPSERQDSYFANIQVDAPPDEDPALKEPLGLSADNSTGQDPSFLEKVNQKLNEEIDHAELSPPSEKGHRRNVSEADDGGPKLRLKQSINFGAPFGQSTSKT